MIKCLDLGKGLNPRASKLLLGISQDVVASEGSAVIVRVPCPEMRVVKAFPQRCLRFDLYPRRERTRIVYELQTRKQTSDLLIVLHEIKKPPVFKRDVFRDEWIDGRAIPLSPVALYEVGSGRLLHLEI